ncbi:Transmembrane protein [Wickerhamomyces ciferrii]|uniref:Transmembrane 9 superfamily member n=1 Tax=Wickerhamomyces ciferrii (strain ATCC 14091 / BCRC 22168 / CBS 111 / JCM 3599 / NBRC 0793 / NRRL Y-1031 F-60-10) TaxID=1206466 RepID=K0KHP8_WICCF|nr:Transmembrane protein [Wickerhamomyces ciferrii]CCH44730.1 Transmembrane protein [Wickerhamomyces ciferrii]
MLKNRQNKPAFQNSIKNQNKNKKIKLARLPDDISRWTPTYYEKGEKVNLLVNRVESDSTQLPYAYYELPFICPPTKDARPLHLSLNEVIRGDRIWGSDYILNFNEDAACHRLCDRITRPQAIKRADELIRSGYVVEWQIDDLPGATTFISSTDNKKYYAAGFPLGFVRDGNTYLNNHVMLVIRFHTEKDGKKTIVGFEVYPRSVSDFHCPGASKNHEHFMLNPDSNENVVIPYTYAVYWREESKVSWSERWNLYFTGEVNDDHIHWISLINSLVLVSFLSAVVGVVLLRTLNRDIQTYNNSNIDIATDNIPIESDKSDNFNNSGWKLISNDVFREPKKPLLLSIILSSGVQVFFTIIGVLIVSVLGILGPNIRNSVLTAALSFFIIGGTAAGYSGIRFFKMFKNEQNGINSIKYSILFGGTLPFLVLLSVLILNCIVWAKDSSVALPFGTVVLLITFFLVLEVPLSIIGGILGNKSIPPKNNANLNLPVKNVGAQPKFLKYFYSIPIFGVIPFGTIYVELLFVFRSVWLEKTSFYYMYGFLSFTILLLSVVVIECVIVAIYLSLIYGDWRWQWRSFWIGTSVAWYIEIYSIYYFFSHLKVTDFPSIVLFFSYTTILSILIGIATGALGLFAASTFIYKIYGAIKAD